jgi:hypothetical protein
MRIKKGQYFADIIADTRTAGVYHCIVQENGSTEILHWTQERTEKDAVEAAKFRLRRLVWQQQRAAG